ncbi:UNVERIFIED_CONTAM: hypothetical protein H355_000140 [Colinus virginianus]|nr:hypothetical protein H355_000140 [Colinus virginianus]
MEYCHRLGASLATIDSEEQMDFMLRHWGAANCWIGLRREKRDDRWTWANGTAFTSRSQLRGGGQCAYLNGAGISSAFCHTEKYWVCSRANVSDFCKDWMYPH